MGRPELPGLCILGTRYREGVQGGGLRSREMSVSHKSWEGTTVEMRWRRSWL